MILKMESEEVPFKLREVFAASLHPDYGHSLFSPCARYLRIASMSSDTLIDQIVDDIIAGYVAKENQDVADVALESLRKEVTARYLDYAFMKKNLPRIQAEASNSKRSLHTRVVFSYYEIEALTALKMYPSPLAHALLINVFY